MKTTVRSIAIALIAATAAACGQSSPTSQAAPDATPADSPPDISGTWGARFVQSLSDNPPMLPETEKLFNELKPEEDPLAICKPPGIPRLMNLAFPFEIVQTPKVVYLLMEYGQHVRRVYIDGQHPENPDPTWLGHSIGHWEGRSLVIDTVGFNDQSWLDMRGHPHSEALHLIERYTLSEDGQSLQYDVTIDDPEMYAKPWQSVSKTHRRSNQPILEYICETG
ncbi:MAG TPA: hypothetical protein VNQ81_09470 [Povalibacter sp.]|nr:hypothetical protein [Povalibacter sp.]